LFVGCCGRRQAVVVAVRAACGHCAAQPKGTHRQAQPPHTPALCTCRRCPASRAARRAWGPACVCVCGGVSERGQRQAWVRQAVLVACQAGSTHIHLSVQQAWISSTASRQTNAAAAHLAAEAGGHEPAHIQQHHRVCTGHDGCLVDGGGTNARCREPAADAAPTRRSTEKLKWRRRLLSLCA
jgi:hypothetical protein